MYPWKWTFRAIKHFRSDLRWSLFKKSVSTTQPPQSTAYQPVVWTYTSNKHVQYLYHTQPAVSSFPDCLCSWHLATDRRGMTVTKDSKSYVMLSNLFIHSVFCLTTSSKPPPNRFLHTVRSRASSFKWEYPLLYLRSSSSFLRLLPRLLVTSISPFIFPSITCFRRQFLRKVWPI